MLQEFENLKYEIRQKRPDRRMDKIRIALDLYEKALARQEAEAKAKRSWWRKWTAKHCRIAGD